MGPADRFLAGVLAAAAPVLIVFEGLANTQALTLAMAWLLVAAAVWAAKGDHLGRHDGLDPVGNERASSARS
jgi:hypothetical protein